jgi:acetyl-CoA C-acetyltransferase
MVAEQIGAKPREEIYTGIGGNNGQFMIQEIAEKIAEGEINISLLCGAEALYSAHLARKLGQSLPWPEWPGTQTLYGELKGGSNDLELQHGMRLPIHAFPLFENAMREEKGLTIGENTRETAELCSAFAEVARSNVHAWFRDGKSPEEIRTVTPENRMICFPYPKFMNSLWNVDQASAILLTNVATAKSLGIPSEKWIYVLGAGHCVDAWYPIEKLNYHSAPGLKLAADHALEQADLSISDIEIFDLYSCFPCVPKMAKKMMGISADDWGSLTVTGGLANFGGPGNNYCSHSVCSMVERLRKEPRKSGLVYGTGWYLAKHSVGIYSATPKEGEFGKTDQDRIQREVESLPYPKITPKAEGDATLETFTVAYDREGKPDYAIIVGRQEDGSRFIANTEEDPALFEYLVTNDVVGLKGIVKHSETDNVNIFHAK